LDGRDPTFFLMCPSIQPYGLLSPR
jgi:hypothetical protein